MSLSASQSACLSATPSTKPSTAFLSESGPPTTRPRTGAAPRTGAVTCGVRAWPATPPRDPTSFPGFTSPHKALQHAQGPQPRCAIGTAVRIGIAWPASGRCHGAPGAAGPHAFPARTGISRAKGAPTLPPLRTPTPSSPDSQGGGLAASAFPAPSVACRLLGSPLILQQAAWPPPPSPTQSASPSFAPRGSAPIPPPHPRLPLRPRHPGARGRSAARIVKRTDASKRKGPPRRPT